MVWCYKLVFGIVDMDTSDFLLLIPLFQQEATNIKYTRSAQFLACGLRFSFTERVVNVCNFVPHDVNFSSLLSFKRTIQCVDFSCSLKCFFCIRVSVSLFFSPCVLMLCHAMY